MQSRRFAEEFWIDENAVRAESNGSVVFDPAQAKLCLDAVANRSCDITSEDQLGHTVACDGVVTGTVAGGGACDVDEECVSQVCQPNDDLCQDACCPGTCQGDDPPTLGKLGQACTSYGCENGAACNGQNCVPRLAAGAICGGVVPCAYGLSCYSATADAPTCMPLPSLGGACSTDSIMCTDLGEVCIGGVCTQGGTLGSPCQPDSCAGIYECDGMTNTCDTGHSPTGGDCGEDESCDVYGDYCDNTSSSDIDGVCAAARANGAACNERSGCESHFCDPTGVCADEPACM
ncbi:MAG TPA: hypothetical protein VGM88_13375 [Kofleriaceae bacterium]